MSRRLFSPLLAALSFSATANAQTPAASVDAIFKDLASSSAPGCAVGATRANAPLFAKAYGMADLEHGIALTPQSVFYMASVSKQFLALSVLLLERDGAARRPRSANHSRAPRTRRSHHDPPAAPAHQRAALPHLKLLFGSRLPEYA